MSSTIDPALDALFIPFQTGVLPWPSEQVLFLRARYGRPLQDISFKNILCEQSFKPEADPLTAAGFKLSNSSIDERYPLILVLLPRQRDEARALLAQAVTRIQQNGRIIACASNSEGARSGEADLEKLLGPITTLSKHKCRVFWNDPLTTYINQPLVDQWLSLDSPRSIENGRFMSRPGLFAWDRIDRASRLLINHLPNTLKGHAADLGSGFGYLSVELLRRCPNISALDLYEAEKRALNLAEHNLSEYHSRLPLQFHWHDVTQGLVRRYQIIITNPPFHTQSRTDRPDIGRRFISIAAEALLPEGQLWLVANRHLPYEEVLTDNFAEVRTVAQEDGFKIIAATKNKSIDSPLLNKRKHRP